MGLNSPANPKALRVGVHAPNNYVPGSSGSSRSRSSSSSSSYSAGLGGVGVPFKEIYQDIFVYTYICMYRVQGVQGVGFSEVINKSPH